jgi:hypothetical protein
MDVSLSGRIASISIVAHYAQPIIPGYVGLEERGVELH